MALSIIGCHSGAMRTFVSTTRYNCLLLPFQPGSTTGNNHRCCLLTIFHPFSQLSIWSNISVLFRRTIVERLRGFSSYSPPFVLGNFVSLYSIWECQDLWSHQLQSLCLSNPLRTPRASTLLPTHPERLFFALFSFLFGQFNGICEWRMSCPYYRILAS